LKVAKDSVVRFDYVLKNDGGDVIDSSDGEPLAYIHGHGQIVPGLERAMGGKAAGDRFDVRIAPADGYGERDDDAIFKIPRSRLPKDLSPKVGQELASRTPDGGVMRFRLVEVTEESVTADANHPLAGESLNFSVSVVEVRSATTEELEHGHAHGAGWAH